MERQLVEGELGERGRNRRGGHDRQTLALPDPNIGLIGLGEATVSVGGYLAWVQVNPEATGTTETVEADTTGVRVSSLA